MPSKIDPKDVLAKEIGDTVEAFNLNSAQLIIKAQQLAPGETTENGLDRVRSLFQEISVLRDAQYEITRQRLADTDAGYKKLIDNAINVTKDTKRSINDLEDIGKTLETMGKAIDLIGRLIIVFAA